jgi:hypothetical protein
MPNNNEQLSIDKFNLIITDGVTVVSNISDEFHSDKNVTYVNLLKNETFIQKIKYRNC